MKKIIERVPYKKPKIKKKSTKIKKRGKKSSQNLKRNEETVLSILKSLSEEENELLLEKDQLLDVEETLKKRIINEIKTKKSRILDLQTEIPELKQRIEDLAKVLEIPVVK
jgi:hypothetical protein